MKEPLIYCGPNLPGGRLARHTVFRGGLPAHVAELCREAPEVRALIVPVSRLGQTRAAVERPGTPEHAAARNLIKKEG